MRNHTGTLLGSTKFDWLGMDAGGWVTGIDFANDGTMVVRCDTTYGYVRGPRDSEWVQLVRAGISIPENELDGGVNGGSLRAATSYAVAIAPTASNVIYHASGGIMWKSTDRGATSVRLAGFKSGRADPSLNYAEDNSFRIGGQHMRVDPANPDVVALGHPVDGLYVTHDGGLSWKKHPDIPAPVSAKLNPESRSPPSGMGISLAFDRASAVVGGKTQTVFVFVAGHGVYRSTTGISGAFTQLPGGPIVASSIAAANGKAFVCGSGYVEGKEPNDTQLNVWDRTAWQHPNHQGIALTGFGVTSWPVDLNTICMSSTVSNSLWMSSDCGVTWVNFSGSTDIHAEDVPWLAWTAYSVKPEWPRGIALGAISWHPTLDQLFITGGVGVFKMENPPKVATTPPPVLRWTSLSKGIQQLLTNSITVAPSGRVHVPVWDRVCFSFDRDTCGVMADRHAPDNHYIIRHGSTVDYAADDENYLVLTQQGMGPVTMSLSTDGGRGDWTPVPSVPTYFAYGADHPYLGGNVAVGNKGNFVWVRTNTGAKGGVRTTFDGGASWITPDFGGVDMSTVPWHFAVYVRRRILVADKAKPGTFYLYCIGDELKDGNENAVSKQVGLWKSTDSGRSFFRVRDQLFGRQTTDFWHSKLTLVPGRQGHLFFTSGPAGHWGDPPNPGNLWFSANEGVKAPNLSGWDGVQDVAIGKAATGASYPAIYVVGWYRGQHGLWRCLNFDPASASGTWENLANWPLGEIDGNVSLGADMGKFGRVYYGLSCGGVIYGDYNYKMRLA